MSDFENNILIRLESQIEWFYESAMRGKKEEILRCFYTAYGYVQGVELVDVVDFYRLSAMWNVWHEKFETLLGQCREGD